ncbi:hypothetical protein [Oceanobacillus profundus]|uniref:DUF3993 domain-containing protein n=1 Tax=Oceanobacillus profundus TaxID=372463 RepID=A0A417YMQ8_9BACI|nr:hypothetical protein [Oceanobacillus profundus]MBR3121041.1 hypothetical protein [Oceanobacillus sp.]PAE29691.1 hypothetical protein CHI07_07675 [Paenibacillus sp. 7884-2]MCM3400171.1 hypothetical protein [Oceanobacillus profundus]MDO6449065.1 hypothetical protein [Oceanobacillus profundus]RHW34595.1 hypothetical protein D1B32_05395 [Oceanobacillus profundus]
MRKKRHSVLKWSLTIAILTCIIMFGNPIEVEHVNAENQQKMISYQMKEKPIAQQEPTLTHENVVSLTNTFMDILVQDVDNDYRVIGFQTKDELLGAFEQVTTKEVAQDYVEFYYLEESDGMYILPTETPPWFIEENDYDMIPVDASTVKVIQENTTELYGDYKVEFEFTYDNGWKITDVNYHQFYV